MAPHPTRCGRSHRRPCEWSDSLSPGRAEPPVGPRFGADPLARTRRPHPGRLATTNAQSAPTFLVFGFRAPQDLLKALISLLKIRCFFLTLGEETLQRLVQAYGLVDLRARSGAISAEPDQLLHVGVGCHHLLGARDHRQVGGI